MTAPHQPARAGGDLRVLRAAVFTAVCVVLAAAGHAIASCATVPLWSLGIGFLAVFAFVAPLAGRERSLPGIAALLALGQTLLHTLFGLGQHGTTATAAAGGPDPTLVARAARLVCGASVATLSPAQAQRILADARLDTSGAGGTDTSHAMHGQAGALPAGASGDAMSSVPALPSLSMVLLHVLAAVATGWLLRRGDVAVRRLLRLSADGVAGAALVHLRGALALVRALLAGLPGTSPAVPRAPRAAECTVPVLRAAALQHSVVRRGPPALGALDLAA
ncbi:hypothetical protein [Streptomyces fructofermentans]|uniref:Integral membrane protein n=1 Tax=Streptomyces fructofermentans TaxID=152141 RepID=A0A918NLN1_9ACTN|nr:hypothetical protein [Streptomyces fructofermentans]GGX79130.1 hypothetical protein GCM10010515_53600 [Streptomyces fructofermentans]